jgi:hypothetical protein
MDLKNGILFHFIGWEPNIIDILKLSVRYSKESLFAQN